jgi:hypothetical protein
MPSGSLCGQWELISIFVYLFSGCPHHDIGYPFLFFDAEKTEGAGNTVTFSVS